MSLPGFNAEFSLYQTSKRYQLKNVYEGSAKDSSTTVYPSATFRGCYTTITALYDCQLYGIYGMMNGWWTSFNCDNRYCSGGGIGLITFP